jgi:hypothetical protein
MATATVEPGRDSTHVSWDSPSKWNLARRTTMHNVRLIDDEGYPMNYGRLSLAEQNLIEGQFLGRWQMEQDMARKAVTA